MSFILDKASARPFIYSKDNIICTINKALSNLIGYSYDEVIGKSMMELMDLLKANPLGNSINFEPVSNFLIYTKNNIETEITISCEDLTNENEKIFIVEKSWHPECKSILDNISDEIIYFDNKGGNLYRNKSAAHSLLSLIGDSDAKSEKLIFEKLAFMDINGQLIPFEDTPVQRVLRGETLSNFIYLGITKDSSFYYEVNGNPIYDNLGNLLGGVVIFRDISHRFEMEEYSILRKVTNNLAFGYVSLSYPDFKIIYINEKAYNTINHSDKNIDSLSALIGNNLFDYFTLDKGQKDTIISDLTNSLDKAPHLYVYNHKFVANSETNYIKIMFQPIFGIDKKIQTVIAIAFDISKEEKAKESLAEALEKQDQIFQNISHELKTPLNVIASANQLLGLNLLNIDSSYNKNLILKNLNAITQNSYRLTKLINNISEISKLESGFYKLNLFNINIVEVVENIVESVSEYIKEQKLKIIFDTEVEEKIIACDPYKIDQIMLNLISNAIKFSDANGIIFVNISDQGDFIEISVKDDGIGIDENHLDLIFVKFLQVKESLKHNPSGTGIGLSLVKSFVELHSGRVRVESQLGKGSTFKVQLPIVTVDFPVVLEDICPYNVIESIKYEFSDLYT